MTPAIFAKQINHYNNILRSSKLLLGLVVSWCLLFSVGTNRAWAAGPTGLGITVGTTTPTTVALTGSATGTAPLTYTWSSTTSGVTFSPATGTSTTTTATFPAAGTYTVQLTVTDPSSLSASTSTSVTIAQKATSISVLPALTSLYVGATQSYSATEKDQFGTAIASQPSFTWSATGGSFSGSTYTAPATISTSPTTYSVTATAGGISGTGNIVVASGTGPQFTVLPTASPAILNGSTGNSTTLTCMAVDSLGASKLTYSWSAIGNPVSLPTFSTNNSSIANNTTATFGNSGAYVLQVTATDTNGLSSSKTVNISVNQTLSSLFVYPSSANVIAGQTFTFHSYGNDQFSWPMGLQDTMNWTTNEGAQNVVVNSAGNKGIFTAPTTGATTDHTFLTDILNSAIATISNITVISPNVVSVNLLRPIDQTVYVTIRPITLSATASDSFKAVSSVTFYANSVAIATVTGTGPTFTTTWTPPSSGAFSITATATASDGTTATSSPAGITVSTTSSLAALGLSTTATSQGYSLSTFAKNFEYTTPSWANIGVGPLSSTFPSGGGVVVTDYLGTVRYLPDTDGQDVSSVTPVQDNGYANAVASIQTSSGTYMTQHGNFDLVKINSNGSYSNGTTNSVALDPLFEGVAMVPNPVTTGDILVSDWYFLNILDMNPVTGTSTVWMSNVNWPEGMAVSPDGSTLYVASNNAGYGDITAYNTSTKAYIDDFNSHNLANPLGSIAGICYMSGGTKGYLLTTSSWNGNVYQIDLSNWNRTLIASGGTRGEYIQADPNGTFLINQTDRIMRLTPPGVSTNPLPTISGVTVNPCAVIGGVNSGANLANLTVTLSGSAPAGGAVVTLNGSDPSASVPTTVLVPAGGSTASVAVTTSPVTITTQAAMTAVYNATSGSAILTVNPPTLVANVINPNTAPGGATVYGQVTLSAPAPAPGLAVQLASTGTTTVGVATSVIVPTGQTSAVYKITTPPVTLPTSASVTATLAGTTIPASFTITPISVKIVAPSANAQFPITTPPTQIKLTAYANESGGVIASVAFRINGVVIGTVTMPDSGTSYNYSYNGWAPAPTKPQQYTIDAVATDSFGSKVYSTAITISLLGANCNLATPASLSFLTVSGQPYSGSGYAPMIGTVTLSGVAPSDEIITLSSSALQSTYSDPSFVPDPNVLVTPANIIIKAGTSSTTFNATVVPHNKFDVTYNLTASYHGISQSVAVPVAAATATPTNYGQNGLTQAAIDQGFTVTTFASGWSDVIVSTPTGIAGTVLTNNGTVLVNSLNECEVSVFPNEIDGQHTSDAGVHNNKIYLLDQNGNPVLDSNGNRQLDYSKGGWSFVNARGSIYGLNTLMDIAYSYSDGQLYSINPSTGMRDGNSPVTDFITHPTTGSQGKILGLTPFGMAINPANGHIVSGTFDYDPVTKVERDNFANCLMLDGRTYTGGEPDGVTVTFDGTREYIADLVEQELHSFNIITGLPYSDIPLNGPVYFADGLATGQGRLSNYIFVNGVNGTVIEINPLTGTSTTILSRSANFQDSTIGDFIGYGSNGTMFLAQTDRVLRLIPPAGTGFGGPVSKVITTRDDQAAAIGTSAGGSTVFQYPALVITPTTVAANSTITNSQNANFDVTGVTGTVLSGSILRGGAVSALSNAQADIEFGVASTATPTNTSYGQNLESVTALGQNYAYSSTVPLSSTFYTELGSKLTGSASVFSLGLIDYLTSACGPYQVIDQPQQPFPSTKNILTFVTTSSNNPQILAGRVLDLSVTGIDLPATGQSQNFTWDIYPVPADITQTVDPIASSTGTTGGWSVEPDHTSYNGLLVGVPNGFAPTTNLEVRTSINGKPYSAIFDTIATLTGAASAPVLLPITLPTNLGGALTANSTNTATITLDNPAPSQGAYVTLTAPVTPNANSYVNVPSYVYIASGLSTVTFPVRTLAPTSDTIATIQAEYNGYRQLSFHIAGGTGIAPDAPVLTAIPSANQVALSWNTSNSKVINKFQLARSLTSGGPYTPIFTGDYTQGTYIDNGVTNGVTYFYVVYAINSYGISAPSNEAFATPYLGAVASPIISPSSGPYNSAISVTITNNDPNVNLAYLYYNVNNGPWQAYNGPIVLSQSAVINAYASYPGYTDSPIVNANYQITNGANNGPYVTNQFGCGGSTGTPATLDLNHLSYYRGTLNYAAADFVGYHVPGQQLNFTATALTDNTGHAPDLFLMLIDPTGNIVAENAEDLSTKTATLSALTAMSGNYTLEVTTYLPGDTGQFNLSEGCFNAQLQVFDGSTQLVSGTSTDAFGTVATGGVVYKSFTLLNHGPEPLTITNVTVPAGFTIKQVPNAPLPPYSSANPVTSQLILGFQPTAAGSYGAGALDAVRITSTDPYSPFTFKVSGTGSGAAPTLMVSSLTVTPDPIIGGTGYVANGTVYLNAIAPSATSVTLSSSNPAAVVPSSVTIPAGSSSAPFNVTTTGVAASTIANITATYVSSATVPITVLPATTASVSLISLTLTPDPVVGGNQVTGTITINTSAPAATTVTISPSDATAFSSIPSSVTVLTGTSSIPFTMTTKSVTTNKVIVISATLNGLTVTSSLLITPTSGTGVYVKSITLNTNPIVGGNTCTGTVTLTGNAPTGGVIVNLSSSSTNAPTSASTVTIPAGSSSASISVNTYAVTSPVTATITATNTSGGLTASSSSDLLIVPYSVPIKSLSLTPNPVVGGNSVTAVVTLDQNAPTNGVIVNLAGAGVTLPATVKVPNGYSTGTFTINTSVVTSAISVPITASYGSYSVTSNLWVTPALIASSPLITGTYVPAGGSTTAIAGDGVFIGTATVTLADVTPKASIYYSLDGSTPTTSSTLYTGPFTITKTTTISAIAVATGYANSIVASQTFQPDQPPIVSIVSPINGSKIKPGTPVVLSVSAASPLAQIASVAISGSSTDVHGVVTQQPTITLQQPPYTATINDITTVGTATFTAVATDTYGISATATPSTITVGSPLVVTPISCGQSFNDELTTSDGTSAIVLPNGSNASTFGCQARQYTIAAVQGQTLNFAVSSSSLPLAIYLLDQNNNVVAQANNSQTSATAVISYVATSTQTYTLEVDGQYINQYGSFTVSLQCVAPVSKMMVTYPDPNTGLAITLPNNGNLDFGSALAPATTSRTITLANVGTVDLYVTHVSSSNGGIFVNTGGTLTTARIAVGTSATYTLTFTPTSSTSGNQTSTLAFTNNSPDNPFVLNLTGRAGAPIVLQSLTLSTSSVNGGTPLTGTVTVSDLAPSGGIVVNLYSGVPSIASVPTTVTIPAGQSSATFRINTKAPATIVNVGITASYNGVTLSAALQVQNPLNLPQVQITAPANAATFAIVPGTVLQIPINATASTTLAGAYIAKVIFYAGTKRIAESDSSQSGSYGVTWNNASAGSYSLTAVAYDNNGYSQTSAPVTITVIQQTTATPVITVTPTPDSNGNVQSVAAITMSDSTTGAFIYYTTDGSTPTANNGTLYNGTTIYLPPSSIKWVVHAVAVATGYAPSAVATTSFTVTGSGSGTVPPNVAISSPADGSTSTDVGKLGIVSIAGSVSQSSGGAPIAFWHLDCQLQNNISNSPNPWINIASGTGAVSSAQLGTLDTTTLLDGLYYIRLIGYDTLGNQNGTEISLVVQGADKVGYTTMSFNDMTVPIAGLPITITRTYDSRMKTIGDFGVGWTLSTSNVTLTQSDDAGADWYQASNQGGTAFELEQAVQHVVTITFPGNETYSFNEAVTPSTSQYETITSGNISYQAMTGTHATLQPVGSTEFDMPDSSVGYLDLTDIDGNTLSYTEFIMTLPDGRQFDIDENLGLLSITDLNGNVTKFSPTSIVTVTKSGATRGVTITRGGGSGNEITAISDQTGHSVTYAQDANDNLASVTDRVGNTTTYTYDSQHNLIGIIDPHGDPPVINTFDANGRLIQTTDASKNVIKYAYLTDTDGSKYTQVTDRLGHDTRLYYDIWGNVTKKVQYLGAGDTNPVITQSTFSDTNNPTKPTTIIDPMARRTDFTYDASGNTTQTVRTPAVTTAGNAMPETTFATYNSNSQLLTSTDAMGIATSVNTYDYYGNLLTTKDAVGNVSKFAYNPDGTVSATTDALGHTTSYGYDTYGDVTSVTDTTGHSTKFGYDILGNKTSQTTTRTNSATGQVDTITTQYVYDAQNRIVKTTTADGATSQTFYNDIGKVDHTIDAAGRVTAYVYDNQGRSLQTTYPDGTTTNTAYDPGGRVMVSTDRSGRVTKPVYDLLDRTIETDEYGTSTANGAAGYIETFTKTAYNADGETTSDTDALGNTTTYLYDGLGRKVQTQDAAGNMVENDTFDADDRTVTTVDANGYSPKMSGTTTISYGIGTTSTYDNDGRVTSTTYPDGSASSTAYDALGRRISETDQDGLTTKYAYDALGRLASVTTPLGNTETYGYDELGEKISQTDANGHTTYFAYDVKGRLTQKKLPAGQTMSRTYNLDGTLASETDYNGRTIWMEYDSYGRLVRKHDGSLTGNVLVTIMYNPDGTQHSIARVRDAANVSYASSPVVTTTYGYDDLGRTIGVTTSNTGGNTSTVSYTFDAAGNKKTETTGSGTITRDYDADNRLISTHFSAAGLDETAATIIASQSYDKSGNLAEKADYNASKIERTTYAYDLLNRLISVVNMNSAGLVISTYSYNLDAAGKRISVNDLTGTTYYDYDNDGRLISENGPAVQSVSYVYDAVGNRTAKLVKGVQVQGFQYDADDRVTNAYGAVGTTAVPYTYDNNGNLLSDGVRTFAWDFENKMYASGVVGNSTPTANYTYNADGIRVQLSTASGAANYTIDPDLGYGDVIEERDNSNNLLTRYDYGDDIIRLDRSSGVYYYISDGLGSTRQLVDSTGAVQDSDTYDAFGNLAASSGSVPNWFLFNEQQLDPTGLYNLRARYMDPTRGEFLGQDPADGYSDKPISLNKYVYASDDGINYFDPSGRDDLTSTIVASGIAGGLISGIVDYAQTGELHAQAIVNGIEIGALIPLVIDGLGGASAILPYLPYIGIAGSISATGLAAKVFSNPASTPGQKAAALTMVAFSFLAPVVGINAALDISGNAYTTGAVLGGVAGSVPEDSSLAVDDVAYFISEAKYNEFYVRYDPVGYPTGQWVTTRAAADALENVTGGRPELLNKYLGTDFPSNKPVYRIDVQNGSELNPRTPTGAEQGSNSNFLPGGKTSGGIPEFIVNQIPKVNTTARQIWKP